MSVNGSIGILNTDGTVEAIYCHNDVDEIEITLPKLEKNYNTEAKVRKLINLGSISVLGKSNTSTIAYHRDRGEDYEDNAPRKFLNKEDYINNADNRFGPYFYLFDIKNNVWFYGYTSNGNLGTLVSHDLSTYDFKLVFKGGQTKEDMRINISQIEATIKFKETISDSNALRYGNKYGDIRGIECEIPLQTALEIYLMYEENKRESINTAGKSRV